jgi:hypothetical protein
MGRFSLWNAIRGRLTPFVPLSIVNEEGENIEIKCVA